MCWSKLLLLLSFLLLGREGKVEVGMGKGEKLGGWRMEGRPNQWVWLEETGKGGGGMQYPASEAEVRVLVNSARDQARHIHSTAEEVRKGIAERWCGLDSRESIPTENRWPRVKSQTIEARQARFETITKINFLNSRVHISWKTNTHRYVYGYIHSQMHFNHRMSAHIFIRKEERTCPCYQRFWNQMFWQCWWGWKHAGACKR